jgi:hypothetical protein
MRKISKRRSSKLDQNALDADLEGARPRRIPGATITSWPSPDIDLDAFFAKPTLGATVTGAAPGKARRTGRPDDATVSLSDGTRITFATTDQFETEGVV